MSHNVLCDPNILSFVESKIRSATIFVVSKTSCKACMKTKKLLNGLVTKTGSIPSVFEVDVLGGRNARKMFIKWLSAKTGIKTVPQIWINGRFVGGNDDIQQQHREGRLVPLIRMKTRKSSIHGRQSNRFNIPIDYESTSYLPGRMKRRYVDSPSPSLYAMLSGNKKWDSRMGRSKAVSNKIIVGQPSQHSAKSKRWSSATATKLFNIPQVQTSNRTFSSNEFTSNSSFMTLPNKSVKTRGWMIVETGAISGWI